MLSMLDTVRLRGLLRGVSHTQTLDAADAGTGEDTARLLTFRPETPNEFLIITRISTQGVEPDKLVIVARDLNRHAFVLQMTPNLEVPEVPLIGTLSEGVEVLLRNRTARDVDVVFHAAVLTKQQMDQFLSGGG